MVWLLSFSEHLRRELEDRRSLISFFFFLRKISKELEGSQDPIATLAGTRGGGLIHYAMVLALSWLIF